MTDDNELALDQEALERAMFVECERFQVGRKCLCKAVGSVLNRCASRQNEYSTLVAAYLTAICYPQQRAVVEAAREMRRTRFLSDMSPFAAEAALHAAVAALDDRTDGR